MTREDLAWLVEDVGLDENVALDLLDAADWAEAERLIQKFGYARDNVIPPPLAERLRSETFVASLTTLIEEEDRGELKVALSKALENLG